MTDQEARDDENEALSADESPEVAALYGLINSHYWPRRYTGTPKTHCACGEEVKDSMPEHKARVILAAGYRKPEAEITEAAAGYRQDFLARVTALAEQAKGDLVRVEGEWGYGLGFDELVARGDDDALLIRAVEADLANYDRSSEWEYGTGFPATLGGFWDEERFPSLDEARNHAETCDEGCVLLRRRPEQPPGPWVPVGEGERDADPS